MSEKFRIPGLLELHTMRQRYFLKINMKFLTFPFDFIIEIESLNHSKWDIVGYSGGSTGLENAVKRWGRPIGPICVSVYFDASP